MMNCRPSIPTCASMHLSSVLFMKPERWATRLGAGAWKGHPSAMRLPILPAPLAARRHHWEVMGTGEEAGPNSCHAQLCFAIDSASRDAWYAELFVEPGERAFCWWRGKSGASRPARPRRHRAGLASQLCPHPCSTGARPCLGAWRLVFSHHLSVFPSGCSLSSSCLELV